MDQISILGVLVALGLSWGRLVSILGAFWDRLERLLGPNLGPNMEPTWPKIDPEINHFLDASWNRFLVGFWWILGAKMEPSWHPNGIKHRFLRKHVKMHLELAR